MKMWDLDDLATTGDLAERYKVGTSTVSNWILRYPDFPEPVTVKHGTRLFSIVEVRAWWRARMAGK